MKRRDFLKSSVAATSVAAMSPLLSAKAAESAPGVTREFYELRLYHLRRGQMTKRFDDFYRDAAIAAKKSRIFELRTYESHSKKANKKKIEMFNRGEIAIFRRTGLTPVLFGETLIGAKMPNLAYLLVFETMAEHDKNWGQFASDPEW